MTERPDELASRSADAPDDPTGPDATGPDATDPDATDPEATDPDGRDVYWFVGGPLDGRVHTREPADPAPPVVRHTHLHTGPKIVHHYDLHEVAGHGGEYRLRDPED